MHKKRYALVGTGSRARMFIDALITTYRDVAELVALCDLSQTRMDWYNQHLQTLANLPPVPTYHADEFDKMIAETHPETVIVTTIFCSIQRDMDTREWISVGQISRAWIYGTMI